MASHAYYNQADERFTMSSSGRIIGIVLLFCSGLLAQFRAGVQGVITDSSGGTVASASVTLTNNDTQKIRKT